MRFGEGKEETRKESRKKILKKGEHRQRHQEKRKGHTGKMDTDITIRQGKTLGFLEGNKTAKHTAK